MKSKAYKVRILLHNMERAEGLTNLTSAERDVLYVIERLSDAQHEVASHEILSHDLTENISRPTVYRALTRLLEENFIVKSTSADRGFFTLPEEKPVLSQEHILRQASTEMLAQATASEQTELSIA
jgi:Fe2+ or Zn2+ uptake regulation protein